MNAKHRFLTRLTLSAVALLTVVGMASAQVKNPRTMDFPELNDIATPEVKRVTLDNGMKLFLLEDHELPTVNASARIRVGSIFDPADKLGLAGIAGDVMRTGGTASKTGDELDEMLESIAASVETWIGTTSGGASFSVLKEDLDTGLTTLADVLMNPEFREDKIKLAKVEARSAISRRNDDPLSIAQREFPKLIYGADSPYARHEEYATIDAITRDDLVAFHKKYYHPNNVSLAIWGDFDSDAIIKKVEKAFKDWQKAEIDFPAMPEVTMEHKNSVNLAIKEDANQAPIIMGHLGIKMDDPDYFPILVMNRVLGQGGFSSRLVKEVRTRLGLAYATGGGINAQWEYPGTFTCFSLTRTENVMQAIEAIRTEIRRMTEEPITAEELKQAKESYLNSFVFNFDTRSEVISRIMTYDYYGFPDDFLQQTKAGVEKVTVDDVLRVAKKHLHPDELQLLVVGNPETFDEPLDKLGTVDLIDISIPEPGDEQVSEATAEDLSKGKEVMMMAVDALGGADANNAVKNYNSKSNIVLNTPQGKFDIKADITTVLPNKVAAILNLPFGEMRQVFDGKDGFMASPQGTQDMPSADKEDTMKQMFRDLVGLVQGIGSGEYEVQYLGTEQVEGADADVVVVSNGDYSTKLYLDAASHLPLKQSYRGKTMMGPAAMEEMYSMWKPIEGVMFPFKTVTMADGEEFSVSRVTSVEVNGTVDETMFDKP